ncbi:MAG: hypothetical protein GXN97_06325 [Aquificae bacterium]|nr:hypothetical protein [Aquificota bacterium]
MQFLKSTKFRWFLTILTTLVGVFLIAYFVPFGQLLKAIREISIKSLLLGFLLYTLSLVLRTLRWKYYYPKANLGYLFTMTAANTFLNNVVPARLGELSIFAFLRSYEKDIQRLVKTFLKVRLLDGVSLITLFVVALLAVKYNLLLGLLAGLLVYPSVVLFSKITTFGGKIPSLSWDWVAFFLSLGSLISKLLGVYIVLEFLKLDFWRFTVGFIGGEISTILPFHAFAGLGTYEASFSLALKLFLGESFDQGVKVAFLSHAFLLLSSTILGGLSLLFLLRKAFNK